MKKEYISMLKELENKVNNIKYLSMELTYDIKKFHKLLREEDK